MNISYTKIDPSGNITLIVDSFVPREDQSRIATLLMERDPEAEQVGFLEVPEDPCCAVRLQMMGGEFCGNATLSAAAVVMGQLGLDAGDMLIEVSGAPEPVKVTGVKSAPDRFDGEVGMPLPESIYECSFLDGFDCHTLPLVRFPGICHAIVSAGTLTREKAEAVIGTWCRQIGSEALGLMFFDKDKNTLTPLVYVESTGSAVWEGSCASGTAAVASYLAELDGEYASVCLFEPRGRLSAEAACSGSQVTSLKLSGSAVIRGKNTVLLT